MLADPSPPSPPVAVRAKDDSQQTTTTTPPPATTNSGWFSKLKIPSSIKASFDYASYASAATSPSLTTKVEKIDHVIFLVHGIGPHEEKWKVTLPRVEKSFRKASQHLNSNLKVKFIPVEWHALLHSQTDEVIAKVTPKGILNTRSFVNNTLVDILLWAHSPYSQTIYDDVCSKLNKLQQNFMKENPDFAGDFSIFAHSLGSVICYDLLCQQPNMDEYSYKYENSSSSDDEYSGGSTPSSPPNSPKGKSRNREGNVAVWRRMGSQPDGASETKPERLPGVVQNIKYPVVEFAVENLFMLGSPAGLFLTTRSIGEVSVEIPKCNNMFNIYNPSDPVTYLIEPLIDEGFLSLPSAMCPHITNQSMKGAVAKSKSIISFYKNYYVKSNGNIDDSQQPNKDTNGTMETNFEMSVIKESTTTVIMNNNEVSVSTNTTEVIMETSPSITKTVENSTKTTESSKSLDSPVKVENPTPPTNVVNKDVFFDGKRFDYRMQPSGIVENISEYASVINAHRCYWGSKDVMLFIVQHLMTSNS